MTRFRSSGAEATKLYNSIMMPTGNIKHFMNSLKVTFTQSGIDGIFPCLGKARLHMFICVKNICLYQLLHMSDDVTMEAVSCLPLHAQPVPNKSTKAGGYRHSMPQSRTTPIPVPSTKQKRFSTGRYITHSG